MPRRLRQLVACAQCGRQYDVGARAAGERLHCSCGAVTEVPEARPRDAAVVRCSACSAPRSAGADACSYCGADFTLHERDLNTLCPTCAARLPGQARFCHNCATEIRPEEDGLEATDQECPACGEASRLRSRRLGDSPRPVLECGRCAGLWVGVDVFRALERSARERQDPLAGAATASSAASATAPVAGQRMYRPCVRCGKLMNRKNYGRRSGVIVDLCKEHGLWFDHQELERLLAWIRSGGLDASRARDREEERARERRQRLTAPPMTADAWKSPPPAGGEDFLTELGTLVGRWLRGG